MWRRLILDHCVGQRSTLAHDQEKSWTRAKVRVYSDSVLCLGKIPSGEEAKTRWASQVKEFQVYYPEEEFMGIDGEAMEFEWNISQDSRHCKFYDRSRMTYRVRNTTPGQFLDRIIMSMFDDIERTKKMMKRFVLRIHNKWNSTHNDFKQVIELLSVLEMNGNGMEQDYRPEGRWNAAAAKMIRNFMETNHPVFTSVGARSRGILTQVKNKTSISFNAEMTNSELLFKPIFSSNQLSTYGAVADWCYRCGAKENEQAGTPSAHEENVNQGLMNSVTPGEVSSLVSTPRLMGASSDRIVEIKTIDDMPISSQLSVLCDLVSWRRIKIVDYCITKPSLWETKMEELTLSVKDTLSPDVKRNPKSSAEFQESRRWCQSLR